MPRSHGTTTARGYGSQHQQLRKRLLAAWKPGQPCAHCGQPMLFRWLLDANGRKVSAIDLGHADGKAGYRGLAHRSCNRRDGQAITAAINRARGGLTPRQLSAVRMRQWAAASATAGSAASAKAPSMRRWLPAVTTLALQPVISDHPDTPGSDHRQPSDLRKCSDRPEMSELVLTAPPNFFYRASRWSRDGDRP